MKTLRIASQEAYSAMVADDLSTLSKSKEGNLHIAVPGGRSARSLIAAVLASSSVARRTILYLVDERLEGERNVDTLLEAGLKDAFDNDVMESHQLKVPHPGKSLSDRPFDRVYLGVGEDGHFASLFPGSFTTDGREEVIFVSDSPKPPKRRATLSYWGFEKLALGKPVALLYFGESKREALQRMLYSSEGPLSLPSSFFKDLDFDLTIITDLEH